MKKRFNLFSVMAIAVNLLKEFPKLSYKRAITQAYVLNALAGKKKGMTVEKIGEVVVAQMTADIEMLMSSLEGLMADGETEKGND